MSDRAMRRQRRTAGEILRIREDRLRHREKMGEPSHDDHELHWELSEGLALDIGAIVSDVQFVARAVRVMVAVAPVAAAVGALLHYTGVL